MSEVYEAVGMVPKMDGPGFATPVFRTRSSNRSWFQNVAEDDDIASFAELGEAIEEMVEYVPGRIERRPGDKALYAFRAHDNTVTIDLRSELSPVLRSDFVNLDRFPYLSHEIASFVDDPLLLAEARRRIDERISERRQRRLIERSDERPSFVPRFEFAANPQEFLERIVIRPDIFSPCLDHIRNRQSFVVLGLRGSGKTVLLRWLQQEVNRQPGGVAIYINSCASSPYPALAGALQCVDAIGLEERKELLEQARSVQRNQMRGEDRGSTSALRENLARQIQSLVTDGSTPCLLWDDWHGTFLYEEQDLFRLTSDILEDMGARNVPCVMASTLSAWSHFEHQLNYKALSLRPKLSRLVLGNLTISEVAKLCERLLPTEALRAQAAQTLSDLPNGGAGWSFARTMELLQRLTSEKTAGRSLPAFFERPGRACRGKLRLEFQSQR